MSNNEYEVIEVNKDTKQVAIISKNPLNLNKVIQKNVLDEDRFVNDLETIIERDFFPDLEKLKIQQVYLEALKNNDRVTLNDLYARYSIHRIDPQIKGFETPSAFETPEIRPRKSTLNSDNDRPFANEEPPIKKLASDDTLDKYLAKNISEDNLSFETIMNDAEKKERAKLHRAWLFQQEKQIEDKHKSKLALPSIEQQMLESNNGKVDTWAYKTKNTLMYIPEGAELTFEEKLELEKRQKQIKHENTRFQQIPFDVDATKASASGKKFGQLSVKLGIDGKELNSDETPKINGYGFVPTMPSPSPGRLPGDESPMMTWGEIDGTPFRLDVTNTPYSLHGGGGPEFKIPDIPERERIALNLEEKASAARRKRKMEALKCVQRSLTHTSSPRNSIDSPNASLTDRISVMSPAAQRLLSSKLNIRPNSNKSVQSNDNTPTQSPLTSPMSGFKSPLNTKHSSTLNNLKANLKRSSIDSLTDDLLKLPKQN